MGKITEDELPEEIRQLIRQSEEMELEIAEMLEGLGSGKADEDIDDDPSSDEA